MDKRPQGCPADYAVRDRLQFGGVLHAPHSLDAWTLLFWRLVSGGPRGGHHRAFLVAPLTATTEKGKARATEMNSIFRAKRRSLLSP
jgi:hypothetical protein